MLSGVWACAVVVRDVRIEDKFKENSNFQYVLAAAETDEPRFATHTHTQTHAHTDARAHTHTHARTRAHTHAHKHTHTHLCTLHRDERRVRASGLK
jgi:hypothetical protein